MPDLEVYIQKILDLKDRAADQRLSLEERKALALELGLTESDWERLEASFTDNLPGTERRVVSGINFRFPISRFLRVFHPLNSRTFRYLLFVARSSS